MTRSSLPALILFAVIVSLIAFGAQAQSDQTETAGIAFTGEVKCVDIKASTIRVEGANGEKGTFVIDPKLTTIMSGSQKVGLSSLHAGQSVTFHNVDKMPKGHTVVAADGSFSSPALDQGQSWSHSFDVPGSYAVKIKEHPDAVASIVVVGAE